MRRMKQMGLKGSLIGFWGVDRDGSAVTEVDWL